MVWLVVAVAVGLTGLLGWYFFGPKRAGRVEIENGVQVIRVVVDGGYSPDVIAGVRTGAPVRLLFDRRESGDSFPRRQQRRRLYQCFYPCSFDTALRRRFSAGILRAARVS